MTKYWVNNRYQNVVKGEYMISFVANDGWDIVEVFESADDESANAYAQDNYPNQDWYVLDHKGKNINA
jgi:G:T-mismatch repair DNA endonuclease (very short patch repair protein)